MTEDKINELKGRYAALTDKHLALPNESNPDAYFNNYLLGLDESAAEALMTEIEATDSNSASIIAQEATNREAREYLAATDWQVIRHRDQIEADITTSLSSSEYSDLLTERQNKRDSIVE